MRIICQLFTIGFALLTIGASAQVYLEAPVKYYVATDLNSHLPSLFGLIDNSKQIQQELLDTNTICLIAQVNRLTKADLATIEIAPGYDTNEMWLYQIQKSDKAFKILSKQLQDYIRNRQEGHSKAFLFTAITNHLQASKVTEPDLRMLMANQPWLAVSWLKKEDSGTYTNKAGEIVGMTSSTTIVNGKEKTVTTTNMPKADEVMRWVSYTVTDGDIAWRYVCRFKPNGQLDYIEAERFDPKETDPQYVQLIKAVENEVKVEMKKNGTYGKFGSIHSFWALKKEKLKAKGVEWRSPSELNPNTCYD